MKKLLAVFLLVVTGSVFAQTDDQTVQQKCEEALLFSLRSDNEGVVECAVFNLLVYNISGRRELATNSVLKELDFLSYNGMSDRIKKISRMAYDFLTSNDTELRLDVKYNYHDKDKLFKLISESLMEYKLEVAEH